MNIAWFSPLRPAPSDIANFTERLRGELQKRFEMRFLTEQDGGFLEPGNGAFFHAGLGPCPHDLLVSLNAGDVPIYNLGNNPVFFAQTWFLKEFKPGIVILHDTKLHHFFEGVYRERLGDEKRYLRWLEQYYGKPGQRAGLAYCRGKVSMHFMAEHFPMTEWAIRNALAVVVHSPHAREEVQRISSAPVSMIPLPYEPSATETGSRRDHRNSFSPENPATLAIFGYLNANRRIIEVLHALATMHERNCFTLDLIGTVFHGAEAFAAAELLGLRDRVTFHGHVPDQLLEELLDRTDLAINLRYPTMGEASGSQLRIWDHALPSLVTDSGGYSSLPPDTIFFVRPAHERSDIQRHLRHFLRRPAFFREKGRRGREWLLRHHLPATYVDALRPICEDIDALRSRHERLGMADRVGRAIAPWAESLSSRDHEQHHAARIAELM